MLNNCLLKELLEFPFILVKDGQIIEVSQNFIDMTGYDYDELINNTLEVLFRTLRVGPNFDIKNIDERIDYFMFTKSFEVKFVNIQVVNEVQGKIYSFIEKTNSNLDDRFYFANALYEDNYYGIGIYSIPDSTLLRANEKYLTFFDKPYDERENCIGKHVSEFITGFEGSELEEIWNTVIGTGKSYNEDEYMYEGFSRGITYWKLSAIPVCEANKVKYCMTMIMEITEQVLHRKKVEEQANIIKQQKKELEAILDNMADGFSIIDTSGNYLKVNKKIKEWMQMPEIKNIDDAVKKFKYYDLNNRELSIDQLPAIRVSKGERVDKERIIMRSDSIERYISISGAPVYDNDGNVAMGVINSRDITESMKYTKLVEQQKLQLETIMENISDLLFVSDAEGKYIYMNKETEKYFTRDIIKKRNEILIKNQYFNLNRNVIPKEDLPHNLVLRTKQVDKRILIMKKGEQEFYLQVKTIPLMDNKGNINMIISIAADITEHIKDLNLIQEQKEQLEAIINSMSDGIIIVDKGTKKLTFLNNTARDFFSSSEKISKSCELINFNKCFYNSDGKEVPFEDVPSFRVFNKGKYNDYRLTIVHPDKKMYVSVNGSPIYNNNGEVKAAVLCIRDMTKYVKKEIELEESRLRLLNAELERNKALERAIEMKDEFLSMISHELRTPLNVISTAIQAMKYICKDEMSDKVHEYMNMIRQNTFRQLRLVNNLLDITRANSGRIKIKKKNIDIVFLTRSITESVNAYASQKGISVIFASLLSEKIIGIDDEKYERILLNLLSNAIKFTPEGKPIIVRLSSMKKNIRVEITDCGIGIPADKLDIIFERFGQVDSSLSRQAEGSGIGLSLVKKFVEALGGSISVKSKVNKGSTFTMLFPSEALEEENSGTEMTNLLDNHIVETINVEFSDIYM